jgi:hypothetical protein
MVESESLPRSRRREDEGVGLQVLKGLGQVKMRLVKCGAEDSTGHGNKNERGREKE